MNSARSAVLRIVATASVLFPLLLAAADTALVQTKTNLRKDPSAQVAPIRVLLPDEELAVLDTTSSPLYLKVKTEDKKTGWVLKKAVEILPDPSGTAPVAPTIPPPSS